MIHDVDVPLASSSMELPFNSQHIRYHSGNTKSTKFSIQCRMPLETHGCQMDTVFGKEEWPCNNVDSKEASNDSKPMSGFVDEDFPYDGMFDIAWNNLCYNMDTSVDLLRNTRHDISSFDFEDSYMQKESDTAEGLGEFNILVRSEKAKCSTSRSLKVGERMKRQDSVLFGNTGENYRMKVVHGDELGYTKKSNIKQGKSSKGSEKYTREQNPSGAKTLQSNRFLRIQKDLELQKNCLFEERCTSGDILSELDSFHNGVKSDSALFEWDLCYKDPFSAFPDPKLYPNRHSSFKRPKLDAPVGCVPPNSHYCEKALFTEPDSPPHSYNPPTFSNIRSKSRDPQLSHASRTVGELRDSSKITDSQGVKNFPTLSRQENVEDKLGLQPTVYDKCHQGAEEEVSVGNNDFPSETERAVDGLSCTDNSHECKEAKEETKMLIETQQTSDSPEHTEETLSATKEVSAKHKKCVDDTKYTVDTHIPFPSQSETEEKEESESERINIDRKGDSGSSYQVMLERCILQLLLVQKVPKEASEHNSGKMG